MPSPSAVPQAITWIIVAYLVVATLAWLTGWWDRPRPARPTTAGLTGHDGLDARISLAIMTAAMAAMLASMLG